MVEDDAAVLGVVAAALRGMGYRVLSTTDPFVALDILQSPTAIDLLLVDVVLPIMDGTRLAEMAVEGRPDLQVLYMSGWADAPLIRKKIPPGRLPLLLKPFTPLELRRRVREILPVAV